MSSRLPACTDCEVQAIGDCQGPPTRADHIASRFCHRDLAAATRIQVDIATIAIRLDRQRFGRTLKPYQSGITASRALDCARAHHGVVLLIDPAFGGDVGRCEKGRQRIRCRGRIDIRGCVKLVHDIQVAWPARRTMVHRCAATQHQVLCRDVRHQLPPMVHPSHAHRR